jgi:DNA-binding beta-propeller fold protein YncE
MIHQTPYGKGIAFEKNNVYWVLDGYEGNIKRYDFGNPHQPGGDDHSGGGVQVYPEFKFTRHSSLPGHLDIDGAKKYLYGCDPLGKRVFRINITTGSSSGTRTKINGESLGLGYVNYTGITKTDTLIKNLGTPVGIDVYGDRLIVSDNLTDEIIIYNISNNYSEVGRIKLKYITSPDPMGVKVGPDGKIYFVDRTNKSAYMIENTSVLPLGINSIEAANRLLKIYPNPASTKIAIELDFTVKNAKINIVNVLGEIVLTQQLGSSKDASIDIETLSNGLYFVQVMDNNKLFTQKFIKQ